MRRTKICQFVRQLDVFTPNLLNSTLITHTEAFTVIPVKPSLLGSRFLGCHAVLHPRVGGALRDIPKNGCEGGYVKP